MLHISRMTRILRQPRGNAMLVGVGGSGKQSSTRISAFVSGMDCVQIAISRGYGIPEFREDIKKLMIQTGVEGKQTVFLFTDSQVHIPLKPMGFSYYFNAALTSALRSSWRRCSRTSTTC